jgi:hypothetical protein
MLREFLHTVLTYSLPPVHAPLDIAGGKSAEVVQALWRWCGVVKVDLPDGPPNIITVIEASQRQKLAAPGHDFHRGEAGSLSGSGHAGRGTKKESQKA